MSKEDLLTIIIDNKKVVDTLIDFLDKNNIQNGCESVCNEVKDIKEYLELILKDIEDDEKPIPEDFFKKIGQEVRDSIDIEKLKEIESLIPFYPEISNYDYSKKVKAGFVRYNFYKSLDFISENTVVVGANGSGKSTLATNIKYNFNEKIGIVIPAQKLLIIPTFDSVPNLEKSMSEYRNFETSIIDSKITYNNTIPYEETRKYGADYKYILNTFFAEKTHTESIIHRKLKENNYENIEEYPPIKLDKAINIWNFLIEHREMFYDDNNNLKIRVKDGSEEYPAYKMSDGEKNIFFLIGRVLLASADAMIIIDEPEMYLHKAIVNKLWDRLENERKDCKFIYLTHDLEFASSRKANKYWIKDFQFPNEWQIEPISENDIPDSLLMKILGSRKKILFCEGKKSSLDIQIYEILFPNYTIIPLEGCSNVINYTRAFNNISNKNSTAIGIVDRDFRTDAQIHKFSSENIYVYSVAEVENLFLLEDFIQIFAKNKKERIDIENLKEKVIDKLKKDKELQISNYVTSYINYIFSEEHIKNAKTQTAIKSNFDDFIAKIDIDKLYNKRKEEIERIIKEKDYLEAIKVYNNKGLLKEMEDLLRYKSGKYSDDSLITLKDSEEAQKVLRAVFPQEIIDDN